MNIEQSVDEFMEKVVDRSPGQPLFHQAVHEVAGSLMPFLHENRKYLEAKILERMTEPDRIVIFRVTWEDDQGRPQVNRAYRVQFNNSIGPYKGGLRFHPSVNLGILKFLGYEQVFKNSLTGLPMGGAKGGSDFDPKGKSDNEVMRFCHALMTGLVRYIGPSTDVPAGDIGVGSREIGFMFGQYKRLANQFEGSVTGKGLSYGGSLIRTEATGYGSVYFAENMLSTRGDSLRGKTALVSGSGNVALYCMEKLIALGAKPLTASDSDGFVHDPDGIDQEKLAWLIDLKEKRRGRIHAYADHFSSATFHKNKKPWSVDADLAFPCATQNEIEEEDAKQLLSSGVKLISEGANMPSSAAAVRHFKEAKILYGPGKAANAGGVAVSGLEQSQNALRISWSREEVDTQLRSIMQRIHEQCVKHGKESDAFIDYVKGANVAGFIKVADAMLAYGIM